MFYYCTNLETIYASSDWNTGTRVTDDREQGLRPTDFPSVARGVLAPLIRHGWPKGNPLKAFFAPA